MKGKMIVIDESEIRSMRATAKNMVSFCDKMLQSNDGKKSGVVSTAPPANGKKPIPEASINKHLERRQKTFSKTK